MSWVYACMHVFMCVRVCVRACVCVHVHMRACVCVQGRQNRGARGLDPPPHFSLITLKMLFYLITVTHKIVLDISDTKIGLE